MFLDTIADALEVLREEASPLGLSSNWSKTKVLSFSDFLPSLPRTININTEFCDTVDDFVYLGSRFTRDCSSLTETLRRLQLARRTFGGLSRVWRNPKIRNATKLRILNKCVVPVFLYGSDTWTLSASTTRRIDAYHRTCLRNILGIHWYH